MPDPEVMTCADVLRQMAETAVRAVTIWGGPADSDALDAAVQDYLASKEASDANGG